MLHVHTFAELDTQLQALRPNASNPHALSPERMAQLMDFLGNPQETYKVIHVAGTSGKTSTAYYTAALLHAAGKSVGLTVSPHVDAINERAQINLRPLPEAEFCAEFSVFLEAIAGSGIVPTYFEACIAFAFWEFARCRVEYVVVEVGIGGLADSTNVVRRADKVCVICDIGYGHVAILGHTLPEIAAQKAGIIQLHNAVFCRAQAPEIMAAVHARARQMQADVHEIDTVAGYDFLPLFQRRNFAMAHAAVQYMLQRDSGELQPAAVALAAHIAIPARMELRHWHGQPFILDAAHNVQKMEALVRSVQAEFPDKSVVVVLALLHDGPKFIANILRSLGPLRPHVIATGFPPDKNGHFGSADPQRILAALQQQGGQGQVATTPAAALTALQNRPEDVLLVTGSFYLLNYIRPLL